MKKIYWKKLKRTMIFIDVSNIYYSQHTLGWLIDYQKVFNFFKEKTNLKAAYFYSGVVSQNAKQKKFFSNMRHFGYIVKTKEVKWIKTGPKKYDTALLFSGDSDFAAAIEFIQAKGKKALVFSSRGHISRELARQSDKYIPFESLKETFARKKSPRQRRGKSSLKTISKKPKQVNQK